MNDLEVPSMAEILKKLRQLPDDVAAAARAEIREALDRQPPRLRLVVNNTSKKPHS